jgi:hypothetical protein
MDIKDLTREELEEELARREKDKKPKPLEEPNWLPLYKLCLSMLDDITSGDADSDGRHYIYEAAMTAVFGNKVWAYINEMTR